MRQRDRETERQRDRETVPQSLSLPISLSLHFPIAIFLVLLWLLVMSATALGYLVKMLVDLVLTELVTFFANLGKRIGMQ